MKVARTVLRALGGKVSALLTTRPHLTLFEAVQRATDSAYTVLVFHGVPDLPHPWVNTEPARFEACMEYLAEQNCRVIPMREIFTAGQ